LRDTTRPGCLGALLALLRIKPRSTSTHVYRLRDDFLSPAESSFLRTLLAICGDGVLVCPKVNLADLVYAPRQEGQFAAWNRINRKHLDFVLCDMDSLRPRLAIELDDKSHSRQDRRERDDFVDGVLESCGLPLLRVPARRAQVREVWGSHGATELQQGAILGVHQLPQMQAHAPSLGCKETYVPQLTTPCTPRLSIVDES